MFCHEMLAVLFAAPLFPKYWCWHECLCSSQLKITEKNRVGLAVGWQSMPFPGWEHLCVCSSALSYQCSHAQQLLQGTPHLLCGCEMSPWGHPALLWSHFQPLFRVQGALLASFPGDSTGCFCISSIQSCSYWSSKLGFGWGIWNQSPESGTQFAIPWISVWFRETFLRSYPCFVSLNLRCCLKVLNFICGPSSVFLKSSWRDSVAGGCHGIFKRNFCQLHLNLGGGRRGIGLSLFSFWNILQKFILLLKIDSTSSLPGTAQESCSLGGLQGLVVADRNNTKS